MSRLYFTLLLVVMIFALVIPVAAQNRTHTVQPGDTLAKISARYNVSWSAIATTNKITNPNLIYVGQVLTIPPAGITVTPPAASFNYTIKYGDTLGTLAIRYNTTVEAILAANRWYNRRTRIFPGDVFVIPGGYVQPTPGTGGIGTTPSGTWYTVRPGDTMFRIAATYRVNVYDLAEVNGILNLNLIYSGQRLRIPGR
jgi:peptidoglycan-N-acetylglucosamine deacetylase